MMMSPAEMQQQSSSGTTSRDLVGAPGTYQLDDRGLPVLIGAATGGAPTSGEGAAGGGYAAGSNNTNTTTSPLKSKNSSSPLKVAEQMDKELGQDSQALPQSEYDRGNQLIT